MAQEKGVYYCYVSSRHQLGAACQTKRPISLVTWPDLADLCYRLNEKTSGYRGCWDAVLKSLSTEVMVLEPKADATYVKTYEQVLSLG